MEIDALQIGKLDLQPGSYLVVKFPATWHQDGIAKLVSNVRAAMPEGVKVLFVPDSVDLSVLTVPENKPDLRTMADTPSPYCLAKRG